MPKHIYKFVWIKSAVQWIHVSLYLQKKEQTTGIRKRKSRHESDSSDSDSDGGYLRADQATTHQCFGPQCTRPARPNSKYCGDECGLKLAEARIYSVRRNFYIHSRCWNCYCVPYKCMVVESSNIFFHEYLFTQVVNLRFSSYWHSHHIDTKSWKWVSLFRWEAFPFVCRCCHSAFRNGRWVNVWRRARTFGSWRRSGGNSWRPGRYCSSWTNGTWWVTSTKYW